MTVLRNKNSFKCVHEIIFNNLFDTVAAGDTTLKHHDKKVQNTALAIRVKSNETRKNKKGRELNIQKILS